MVTFDQALDTISKLPIDQQWLVFDILQKRLIDLRRKEISQNAKASIKAFHKGELKSQSLKGIISELRSSLKE